LWSTLSCGDGLLVFDGKWRASVDRATKPVGETLRRSHITPNQVTLFGMVISGAGAVAIGSGHLIFGAIALALAGFSDLFDGPLAKASGRSSTKGAFLDSVADRVSDAALFGGVAWYLSTRNGGHIAMLPVAVLAATMLVSYERAKAESLGLSAKGGIMERAERVVALGIALLVSAILIPMLWLILGLTLVTAASRFLQVWHQAPGPQGAEKVERHVRTERQVHVHRRSAITSWRDRNSGTGPNRWRSRRSEERASRVSRRYRGTDRTLFGTYRRSHRSEESDSFPRRTRSSRRSQ